uniref:Core-binding (CB) domain-containing protein n=1 Tax=Amphimedon queenslandica TaxID=400682 RepID=A0A1X7UCW1_AMPQE
MWCLERDILLTAQHLPGKGNVIADSESRVMRDRCNWMLNPVVLQRIMSHFSNLQMDLFATRLTYQLPRFFSWRPDPLAEETDAFLQDWTQVRGYANPPWNLVERVLAKVEEQQADIILMAQMWPSQLWYPRLLGMAEVLPSENQPSKGGSNSDRTTTTSDATSGRVAYLRQHYACKGLSGEAADLLLSSWRHNTSLSYDSLCRKWISWSTEQQADPISGPIEDIVNFLAQLYKEGYQYRSLNAYRSAISSMHTPIEGQSIGQHPLVSRLLKGAFQTCSLLPRYQSTWDVSRVLRHIKSHQLDNNLSLKLMYLRTVMLLALTRPSRSADLLSLV